jgi:glycosyltransferase
MKISIITAVFNRRSVILDAITSIQIQFYSNVEHIVVDGVSTDGTVEILKPLIGDKLLFISEPDRGIYDAINKGISISSGEVIGLLHSDDFFVDSRVLSDVAKAFEDKSVNAVFGDLEYVSKDNKNHVVRYWRAGEFKTSKLKFGWMPPHPALFLRRNVFEESGVYDTELQISADYDAILRYFQNPSLNSVYIPRVLVRMRLGGQSNQSFKRVATKMREDYDALVRNGIGGAWVLIFKNLRKINQFIQRGN